MRIYCVGDREWHHRGGRSIEWDAVRLLPHQLAVCYALLLFLIRPQVHHRPPHGLATVALSTTDFNAAQVCICRLIVNPSSHIHPPSSTKPAFTSGHMHLVS